VAQEPQLNNIWWVNCKNSNQFQIWRRCWFWHP